MNISEKEKNRIIELIDNISNNLYGIADYCNLSKPKILNYSIKEHPIDIIEEWAEDGKRQIDELEKIFNG